MLMACSYLPLGIFFGAKCWISLPSRVIRSTERVLALSRSIAMFSVAVVGLGKIA